MHLLGIETSCDETAVAVVTDGYQVRANLVSSQVAKHAQYGGVIPELAAREHLRALHPMLTVALADAGLTLRDLGAVAVTHTPGLLPALLVGLGYAKGLATSLGIPLIGINHVIAHVYGALLDHPDLLARRATFPILALIVSGGHTLLLQLDADGSARVLGQTLDDAAGEAFDKAAKILHLPYPGGPIIDQLAQRGDPAAYDFPRGLTGGRGTPLKPEHRLMFSFSGLKTALLYQVRREPTGVALRDLADQELLDLVASYQEAIVDTLTRKTLWAAADHGARTIVLCGGVACNSRLRTLLRAACDHAGLTLLIAPPKYCTDNAAMIAGLAYHYHQANLHSSLDLDAIPRFAPAATIPLNTHLT